MGWLVVIAEFIQRNDDISDREGNMATCI